MTYVQDARPPAHTSTGPTSPTSIVCRLSLADLEDLLAGNRLLILALIDENESLMKESRQLRAWLESRTAR